MKGYLNKDGELYILRNGIPKLQRCPYSNNSQPCGDKCPLFSEPKTSSVEGLTMIDICHWNYPLKFEKGGFLDRRKLLKLSEEELNERMMML